MIKKIFTSILIVMFGCPVFASKSCTGMLSDVSISASGNLYVSIKNSSNQVNIDNVAFCNVNQTQGKYNAEACKVVYGLMLSGVAQKKTGTAWFKDDDFSCAQSWGSVYENGFYHFRING